MNSDAVNSFVATLMECAALIGMLWLFWAIINKKATLSKPPKNSLSKTIEGVGAGLFLGVVFVLYQFADRLKSGETAGLSPAPAQSESFQDKILTLLFCSFVAVAWFWIRQNYSRLQAYFQVIAGLFIIWKAPSLENWSFTDVLIAIGGCFFIVNGLEAGKSDD